MPQRKQHFYFLALLQCIKIKRNLNCSISEQGYKKRTTRGIKPNKSLGSSLIVVQGKSIPSAIDNK